MASTDLAETHGLRIAVEGCGHGHLHDIYASVAKACELKQWPGVDVLIIGGDFQAVRNALDLKTISMPEKYYAMGDFHEYYSGQRTAPYLTIFIGGNHEASSHMWELYYGGWAAPNMYYMGAANVVRLGPLRIAGLSGIWKGFDYKKPHYERLPYNSSDIKSIYHVRELDTRKLLQLRSQVDIGLSHDWPRGMEWKGDHRQLFKFKPYFEQEAREGSLGSVAAQVVLERLRPKYWFSAHMHAKYAAIWEHKPTEGPPTVTEKSSVVQNTAEIDIDLDDDTSAPVPKNDAEIDLDMDDDAPVTTQKNEAEIDLDPDDEDAAAEGTETGTAVSKPSNAQAEDGTVDIRSLLPDSFARPKKDPTPELLPFPAEITNMTTRFLALDKCLPNRHFLQLQEIAPEDSTARIERPLALEYDKEWLAITRVFSNDLQLGDPAAQVPPNRGDAYYRPLIEKEMDWVEENIVKQGKMAIPQDFERTASVYDPSMGIRVEGKPREYTNPHTKAFCELLQIPNPFDATQQERGQRMQQGPRPDPPRGGDRRGGRGGSRGGFGRGHGGGRGGGGGRGRGRGRGRGH